MYEALAYIIVVFVGFIAVVNVGGIADPLEKVAAIVENQGLLTALHLLQSLISNLQTILTKPTGQKE